MQNPLKFYVTLQPDKRTIAGFDIASDAIKYSNDYVNVWKCDYIEVIQTSTNDVIHNVKRTKPNDTTG